MWYYRCVREMGGGTSKMCDGVSLLFMANKLNEFAFGFNFNKFKCDHSMNQGISNTIQW